MFKLSLPGLLVAILVLAPIGVEAADQPYESDAALVAAVENSEFLSKELLLNYREYLFRTQQVEIITHTIKRGETLISIAEDYGVSVATISESNDISNPHLVHPGQELVFPAVSGLLYTVEDDDSLSALAQEYEVDIPSIMYASGLTSQELEPGDTIIIPGAKLPEPPPMPRPTISRSTTTSSVSGVAYPAFSWPLRGSITSPFGPRGSGFHRGLDINGDRGDVIRAAASGVVTFSGWRNSYGYTVIIEHGNDVSTLYAHASKLMVSRGQRVSKGDTIALVGSTGHSTGPHLHFEVIARGVRVNPRPRLP